MPEPQPAPGPADSAPAPALPELHETVLDPAGLQALFRDLAALATVLAVIPRRSPRDITPDHASCTLHQAENGLLAGTLRSAQIRYLHDGGEWWDTLLAVPAGFRLVRIQQDRTAQKPE